MTEPTNHELHEGVRQREALLNEASRLLAGGAGEDSPEYEEFKRLREELPEISRTPELTHANKMVRRKVKELRQWLRRMDRALGSADPVEGVCDYIRRQIDQRRAAGDYGSVAVLSDLLIDIERGEWVVVEDEPELFHCSGCDKTFDNREDLFNHCAHTTCQYQANDHG